MMDASCTDDFSTYATRTRSLGETPCVEAVNSKKKTIRNRLRRANERDYLLAIDRALDGLRHHEFALVERELEWVRENLEKVAA